ncbi:MAG TPA: superoxide dismutase [Candidatus Saccharimonadales bacterium]|nr:superoxide dismutase [Candidatus Saccharimonadales bacterium]
MFELPGLPYGYDALEPFISSNIQHLHHDKHHQGYVDNLNKAVQKYPEWESKTIEEIIRNYAQAPDDIKNVLRNHGGGHYNHSMFWEMMSPKKEQAPSGGLLDKINESFGDYEAFRKQFSEQAVKVFGSGWQWLVMEKGKLSLMSTPNQDSPLTQGKTPVLGLDVWEHAYYLQYYNKRPDYVEAWWHVVNWEEAAKRFEKAK